MKLGTFRSLWGSTPTEWPILFQELKDKGFEGVEASLGGIIFLYL